MAGETIITVVGNLTGDPELRFTPSGAAVANFTIASTPRNFDRQTGFLLPPSVDEWLPQKHLARFVVEVIDGLDVSAMSNSYRGSGSASYHPKLLLGALVYGYAAGVFSSRKLERATYDSVAFRFIAANDHPDHDTIATFRRRFLKDIEGLFVQVLLLARADSSVSAWTQLAAAHDGAALRRSELILLHDGPIVRDSAALKRMPPRRPPGPRRHETPRCTRPEESSRRACARSRTAPRRRFASANRLTSAWLR